MSRLHARGLLGIDDPRHAACFVEAVLRAPAALVDLGDDEPEGVVFVGLARHAGDVGRIRGVIEGIVRIELPAVEDAAPRLVVVRRLPGKARAASVRNLVAMGPRVGRPLRMIVLPGLARDEGRRTHEGRGAGGFDLDIGPVVRADERGRLERLCRHLLRPPLATERLEELPDGRLKYAFRHPWRDG